MESIKNNDHYKKVFGFNSDVVYHKMGFLEKFAVLGNYNSTDSGDFKIDIKTVIDLTTKMGHPMKYSNSKKFYLHEASDKIISTPAFDIRYNRFELAAIFKFALNKAFISGAPWTVISDMLSNFDIKYLDPKCQSLNEMEFILENYFKIYEELKIGMIDYFKDFKIEK